MGDKMNSSNIISASVFAAKLEEVKEKPKKALWQIEYTPYFTCPGCNREIDSRWEKFKETNRCPLCNQKIKLEIYIT